MWRCGRAAAGSARAAAGPRAGPRAAAAAAEAPRGAAGPATLIADGRRSVGLLSAELCLTLKTRGRGGGVQLLVAGRRGVTLALQAVAQAQPERPLVFALSLADGEELAAAGLHPPGQGGTGGASDEAAPPGGEEAPAPRRGFRFFFPGHADEAETMDVRVGAAPSRVLLVKSEGSLLPLTKAVATEVARLPEGATAAVETLLGGKAKSIWTRTHRMAEAVAQAYQWQVAPASPKLWTRPFRCVAAEVAASAAPPAERQAEGGPRRVLRLTLLPEGPSRPGQPAE